MTAYHQFFAVTLFKLFVKVSQVHMVTRRKIVSPNGAAVKLQMNTGTFITYKQTKQTNFISYQLQYIEKHDHPRWMTISKLKNKIIQHGYQY